MNKFRVALVGAGGMARNYRNVYGQLPDVEFALAVDLNDDDLKACQQAGAKRVSHRFEDALAPGIDMLDISTPNFLHEPQTVAALAAGKHVLLQKPMANNLAAAARIVEASRHSAGVLGMYMSSYANPLVWEIKRLIASGALGSIQSVHCRDAHRGGLRAVPNPNNWRGSKDKTGGGSFIQLSIHGINLVRWWLDDRITQVFAYSANQYCPNIGGDDVTSCVAQFASGTQGSFISGYASDGMAREVYGTKGYLKLLNWDKQLELVLDQPWEGQLISYKTPGVLLRLDAPPHSLGNAAEEYNPQRRFINAVRTGKRPLMTGEDGYTDLAVVMAAYESAQTGQVVNL